MPYDQADAGFLLARALAATGRESARAGALARTARDAFAASPGADARVAEVDGWLARKR